MSSDALACLYDSCKSNQFIMVLDTIDSKSVFNKDLLSYIEKNKNTEAQAYFTNIDPSNLVDNQGYTLLHHSVRYHNTKMAQYFIDKGCNVDAVDNKGNSSLMLAVQNNNITMIKVLLEANADVFICNQEKRNFLHYIFENLIERFLGIAETIFQVAKRQCLNDNHTLLMKLLEAHITFPECISFRDVNFTKYVLEHGCTINDRDPIGNSALHYAVASLDLDHVKMLVENKIDVQVINYDGRGPLHFYNTTSEDTQDKLAILKTLMDHGALLNAGPYGNCMLEQILFQKGKKELIVTLIQWNVNFISCDQNGKTLLHIICKNDSPTTRAGIDAIFRGIRLNVNARDCRGRTALWNAVEYNNYQMLEFLLKNGANVNTTDETGKTVIFYGLKTWHMVYKSYDSLRCFEIFLQYEVDLQYVCQEFDTIFHPNLKRYDIVFALFAHLAMLEAIGEPINDHILKRILIPDDRTFKPYFNFCKWQILSMKNTIVYESISLFDILTANKRKLALLLRNERLLVGLKMGKWQTHKDKDCSAVAYYNRIYWTRVTEAQRCAELMESAGRVIARAVNINYIHCVMDEMMSYLDSHDLQNICLTNFSY